MMQEPGSHSADIHKTKNRPAIVTVHGTFASAPTVTGEKWWQLESDFSDDVQRFVGADQGNGDVEIIPVVWSGDNSEADRRKGSEKLYDVIQRLEHDGRKYCMIGHSHGGSVISLSLMKAANAKQELPGLMKWLTVGTPFIEMRKHYFLFSRVSYMGKSTLISLSAILLLFALSFYFDTISTSFNVFNLILLASPFVVAYVIMRYFNGRRLFRYQERNWRRFKEHFADRWIALNHPDDEAVEGLSAIGHMQMQMFSKRFAVAPLTFLGSILVPVVLFVLLFSPSLMEGLEKTLGRSNRFGDAAKVSANVQYVADYLKLAVQSFANWAHLKFEPLFSTLQEGQLRTVIEGSFSLLTLIFVPIIALLLISYAILGLINVISLGVSYLLSRALNRTTWAQVRSAVYGSDAQGEFALSSGKAPFWMSADPTQMPDELATELSQFSNEYAARSIPHLRTSLKRLVLADGGTAQPDIIAQYLTWNELIHTSYFRLPRFRKFVSYMIANEDGFRPRPELAADTDLGTLQRWQHALTSQTGEAPTA